MTWIASQIKSLKKWTHDGEGEPIWERWMFCAGATVLVVLLFIATIQYLLVSLFGSTVGKDTLTRFGISGDFFGFANAVFSALAFAMIIVTLWMQKHELTLQRKELKDTRDEFEKQRHEMKLQNASLKRQTFENTFFGMLSMHSDLTHAISVLGGKVTGRIALNNFVSDLEIKKRGSATSAVAEAQKNKISVATYEQWYTRNEAFIGHYLRTLYNMMRYIDEQGGEQRAMYARLVRAQLSSNELNLLFFNGLSKWGQDKMKPLIEKYALLKHLRFEDSFRDLKREYDESAYSKLSNS